MNFFDDHHSLYDLSKEASREAQRCYTTRYDNTNHIQNNYRINCEIKRDNDSFNNNFLLFDKDANNNCNPRYTTDKTAEKPPVGPSCVGFACNRDPDVFAIQANNCHTYRNGIRANATGDAYCTYHQIFNNITRAPVEKKQWPSGCGVGDPVLEKHVLQYDKAPPCIPKCTPEHPYV